MQVMQLLEGLWFSVVSNCGEYSYKFSAVLDTFFFFFFTFFHFFLFKNVYAWMLPVRQGSY